MFTILKKLAGAALAAGLAVNAPAALANGSATYHVTITNITHSINFTPIMVASHRHPVGIFELGAPAGDDLAAVAEGGDTSLLQETLEHMSHVVDIQSSGGLLGPGQSVTVVVSASHGARRISLASMMLPTNDGFIALDSVRAPRHGSATYFSPGYDAGTEANDELCASIPGPTCDGTGLSPGDNPGDEKFVHIHRGMHGVGELDAAVYDWRNPVAKITVTRVRH
ncbi:MAG: spondin domain-containing protein [Gammaproteobacteria bacterium]|nr:spondin domain-containing protein [Gammaproteobacteria bacterium]